MDNTKTCPDCGRPNATYGQVLAYVRGELDPSVCHGTSDTDCTIVRLRQQLARVEAERDEAVKDRDRVLGRLAGEEAFNDAEHERLKAKLMDQVGQSASLSMQLELAESDLAAARAEVEELRKAFDRALCCLAEANETIRSEVASVPDECDEMDDTIRDWRKRFGIEVKP